MTLGHDTHGANPDDVRPVPRIAIQAFCETVDVAQLLEATAEDRRMSRAHLKIQMGGLPAAVEFYASAPTPNLVLVESRGRAQDILSQLDGLADVCDPGTKVMVIGHVNDVVLYRDLVRRGVSEYIVMPLTMFDVVRAIGELYEHASTPLGRTVAVLGAKGGTGSSTVAHNVAWAVGKQFANDVMIADFDLAWGTAGLDFNQDPTQGMLEALNSPERLDEVFLDRLLTKCSDRLSILAAPALLDRTYDQRENDYDTIVEVARSIVPLVILDLPHQWTSWVRRQTCEADDVFLVATPDLASLRNARALIDALKGARPNDAPPHLVINTVGMPKRPEIKPEEFAKALELETHVAIPFDAVAFGNAANKGLMIGELDAKHAANEAFSRLAMVATGRKEIRKGKRGAFDIAPLLAKLGVVKAS
jgi:pilus assembly protein CpaE